MTGGKAVIRVSARDAETVSKSTFFNFHKEGAMRTLIVLLFVGLLAGCGTLGGNTVALSTGDGEAKKVSIDPVGYVGVQWTKDVSEGRFTAHLANFPPDLFSEFHPLRVRYNAVAYGEKSGREYPVQAIYAGYAQCALRLTFIVEGNQDESVVGAIATTRYGKLYNLYGEPISVKTPEKLISDAAYRKEAVLSGGTAIRRLKSVPIVGQSGLFSTFNAWSTVRVKGLTDQRTPLAEQSVRLVARENPELSFSERLVANGSFGISIPPSWFGVAMGVAQDIFIAANASGKGWDEESELRRGYQGMIARVIAAQYQAAINAGMSCAGRPTVVKY